MQGGNYFGLGDYPTLSAMSQAQQRLANLGRIPGALGLEAQSSSDIASLLNPPSLFPDTSRIAAETAAGRGIAGSGAGYSTAVRMTDEERLKRMALGQQMLDQAYARNPAAPPIDPLRLGITPYQQEELALRRLGITGGPGRGIGSYSGGMPNLGHAPSAPAPELSNHDTPWLPPWSGGHDPSRLVSDVEDMDWSWLNEPEEPGEDSSTWMDYNAAPVETYPGINYNPYEAPQYDMPQYPPWEPTDEEWA